MAKPRTSSKTVAGKQVCDTCKEPKSALDYASTTATTCVECTNLAVEDIPVADACFLQTDAEVDYTNPTSQEIAARTLARRKLMRFIKRFRPKYLAGWVHEDICRRLERFLIAVENKESPRMVLMMPVRMGKSEIGSRHFAPWVLGHHPDWEIIAASGGQSLAITFSRYIRDLMRDPSYKALFPEAVLDQSSQSVENWNTTKGGGYMAAGIGTMIVGRGANILLIDDPCTSAEAADSAVQRESTWEWYIANALNRLAPGGGVLGIMTHWNEDDWAGRVQMLSKMEGEGDKFEIVKYPAINDQGDEYILPDDSIEQFPPGSTVPEGARMTRPMNTPLHEERYTLKNLLNTKATYYALGQQRWWAALYQQNPSVEDGTYFTKNMFKFYQHEPHALERRTYQAWDFAITEKQQNDYTVGATAHQDSANGLYITDIVRFKSDDAFIIADAILDNWVKHGSCALLGFEDGQIWKSISAVFLRRCQERSLFPAYELLVPLSDKGARAQPLKGLMQSGKVWFKDKAHWWEEARKELTQFMSGGKHDDIVDACFIAGTEVTMAGGRQSPIEQLRAGDWVDTPCGPRLVLDARCTLPVATVYRVELCDGRELIGTAGHPVSTERGWVPLADLTVSDIIHVRQSQESEQSSWVNMSRKAASMLKRLQTSTRSSSTENCTAATLTRRTLTCAGIFHALAGAVSCTATCGRFTTDLFQKVTSFTTRTKTTSTTTSATLSACRASSTPGTGTPSRSNTAALTRRLHTSLRFAAKLRSGIVHLKVLLGTRSMGRKAGKIVSLSTSYVSSAGEGSSHYSATLATAASRVETKPGTQPTLNMVRRSVLAQKHAVYNLSVDDVECYYANGVLVHNCAWVVRLSLRHIAPKAPAPKPMKSWKDKLKGMLGGKGGSHMAA